MPGKKGSSGEGSQSVYTLADVMCKLTTLGSDLADMKDKQGEVITSIDFLSAKFDEMKKQLEKVQASNDALQKENDVLKAKVSKLELSVVQLEQYSRGQNIEIAGIPEKPNENVNDIVLNVLQKVSTNTKADDVDIVHRVGPATPPQTERTKPRPILVRFKTRRERNKIYEQRKSLMNFKVKDLELGFRESTNIFINENLTPSTKQLLYKANTARKDKGYRFIWTNSGRILVRKGNDTPAILIATEEDLIKIK